MHLGCGVLATSGVKGRSSYPNPQYSCESLLGIRSPSQPSIRTDVKHHIALSVFETLTLYHKIYLIFAQLDRGLLFNSPVPTITFISKLRPEVHLVKLLRPHNE
jgi:hypothetical protein